MPLAAFHPPSGVSSKEAGIAAMPTANNSQKMHFMSYPRVVAPKQEAMGGSLSFRGQGLADKLTEPVVRVADAESRLANDATRRQLELLAKNSRCTDCISLACRNKIQRQRDWPSRGQS